MRSNPIFALLALLMLGAHPEAALVQELHVPAAPKLVDEIVSLQATGLAPYQAVLLRAARTDSAGRSWQAVAWFRADARGVVDPASTPADSGSYSGVRPMALFTAMDLDGERHGRARWSFGWRDTLRTTITLEVQNGGVVARETVVQTFVGPGVSAQPVRDSGVVGTLFVPAQPGEGPAVLVIGGSEGGVSGEELAAQLASHGMPALAVGYFGADGLPQALDRIPLEYFSVALRILRRRRGVESRPLAIVATSKGAEAALLTAAFDTLVHGVVAYAPSSVAWSCICAAPHASWTRGGLDVPFVPAGTDPAYRPVSGAAIRPTVNYRYRLRDSTARALASIPAERIRGPLLLIAGGDDGLWPSAEMTRAITAKRRAWNTRYDDVVLEYPNAGHLIGKAYLPAGSTVLAGGRLETGGTPAANADAQADAWPRVLQFLRALRVP